MKFCWVTITVFDMEKSLLFYQDVLGLKINRRMQPRAGTEIVFLGTETDTEIELIQHERNSHPEYGKDISLGFEIDNVDTKITELQDKNIPIHSGPFQPSPIIKFFYVEDPNGLKIQLVEHMKT